MMRRQALVLRRLSRTTAYRALLHRARPAVLLAARSLATAAPSPNDPFANGTNTYYIEEMYRRWRQDPQSVHASWDVYFAGMDHGLSSQDAFQPPPNMIAQPAGGVPTLEPGRGAELDVHLKARLSPASSFSFRPSKLTLCC